MSQSKPDPSTATRLPPHVSLLVHDQHGNDIPRTFTTSIEVATRNFYPVLDSVPFTTDIAHQHIIRRGLHGKILVARGRLVYR